MPWNKKVCTGAPPSPRVWSPSFGKWSWRRRQKRWKIRSLRRWSACISPGNIGKRSEVTVLPCESGFPRNHLSKLSANSHDRANPLHRIRKHIIYVLKTNKYSCARSRKLYLRLFVFQYPVALQLCCSLIIISFSLNPAFWKTFITLKPKGITCPFCLVSPIRIAQYLSFRKTR